MKFTATKKCNNCIEIEIDETVDLSGASVKILGKDRDLLAKIINPTHTMQFCLYTGAPMFIEVLTSEKAEVQYVKGSGDEYYKNQ